MQDTSLATSASRRSVLVFGFCLLGLAGQASAAEPLFRHTLSPEQVRRLESLGAQQTDGHDLSVDVANLPTGSKYKNNEAWSEVTYEIIPNDYHVYELRVSDTKSERFMIPEEVVSPKKGNSYTHKMETYGITLKGTDSHLNFAMEMNDVTDNTNQFFTTVDQPAQFYDKYVQIDFKLPSQRLYGFGERTRDFALTEGSWTMWAKEGSASYDDGSSGLQSFGVHPFLLVESKRPGVFFGMYFHNSNLQSPVINFDKDGGSTLHYLTTGGNLQIFVFSQGDPEFIVKRYHDFIGKPTVPPFYALGFYQGSETYTDTTKLQAMVTGYSTAGMPLEGVMPSASAYLENGGESFILNTVGFKDAQQFSTKLHAANQKIIPELQPGITQQPLSGKNTYFDQFEAANALIKSIVNPRFSNNILQQKVLLSLTTFPNYFNSEAKGIYQKGMADIASSFALDGAWLNQNEPFGQCDGECPEITGESSNLLFLQEETGFGDSVYDPHCVPVVSKDAKYSWYQTIGDQSEASDYCIPFDPGFVNAGFPDHQTLSLNATHLDTDGKVQHKQYDAHSLYGLQHTQAVSDYWSGAKTPQRPFVMSRSTFPSSGMYGGHFIAKTERTWSSLRYSVAGIMNFNMFGIPFTGADVCGATSSAKTLDEELCARWAQLATFYPFARNFYDATTQPSEFYAFQNAEYKEMAKAALWQRTEMLRFMYTEMARVHREGGSVVKPMFFAYPTDTLAHRDHEQTFLVGDAIKVSPVIDESTDGYYPVYFPAGTWVELGDFSRVLVNPKESLQFLPKPTAGVNAHIRAGQLFPWQDNTDKKMKTTTDLLQGKISLVALRDEQGHAEGQLFVDDGSDLNNLNNQLYDYHKFQINKNVLTRFSEVEALDEKVNTMNRYMDKIIITNAEDLAYADFACAYSNEDPLATATALDISYNKDLKALFISPKQGTNVPFTSFDAINWGRNRHDMNWCDSSSFQYRVASGVDTDNAAVIMQLEHTIKVLPSIQLTLLRFKNDVLEVKMTWNDKPGNAKTPFEPPNVLTTGDLSFFGWSDFIEVNAEPFWIKIMDPKDKKTVIFDTESLPLGFGEFFTRFGVRMHTDAATPGIWGLGEQVEKTIFLKDGIYSQWDNDVADPPVTGKLPGTNMYGTHPFWMYKSTGNFVGMFLNNVNAMDHVLKSDTKNAGQKTLVTTTTGGNIDFFVMTGTDPNQVVRDYHGLIGTPVPPKFVALGWQQCRWGWKSVDELKAVLKGYSDNDLPLDVFWSDIDYMENYRDFTYGTDDNYKGLPDFVKTELHQTRGISYVPIIDAGVAYRNGSDYKFFNDGVADDVFIKGADGQPFVGRVWPNEVAFPDFYNPKTPAWWQHGIDVFHGQIPFDGLWLDMNEASNFCDGPCFQRQKAEMPVKHNLPYVPSGRDLEHKAISLDATHYGGVTELDAHSTFGYMEVKATSQWFAGQNERPFIVSRSTIPGSGAYGSAWLGDNFSTLDYMTYSVPGIMNMNMFGISLVGPDICGFNGHSTDPLLCTRWTVLGALYPFSRNHNVISPSPEDDQYPYSAMFLEKYEGDMTYTDVMREGIRNKYALARYYYAEMLNIASMGGQFFRPVFYDFPTDVKTWQDEHNNFMIGSSLKASMLTDSLTKDTSSFYFPKGAWCNVWTHKCMESTGEMVVLGTKAYDVNLHLKEGAVLPMVDRAELTKQKANTLEQAMAAGKTSFYANPSITGQQEGTNIWTAQMHSALVTDDGLHVKQDDAIHVNVKFGNADSDEKTRIYLDFVFADASAPSTCDTKVQSSFLGEVMIYRATATLMRLEDYLVVYVFRDGSYSSFKHDLVYDEKLDAMVLTPAADTPVCLNNLTRIVALRNFGSDVQKLLEELEAGMIV